MSLKSTSGTSLTEVMVMMVILGISLVGIYSMVHSGRELALLTNTRLAGINIAREGLESVSTLRDTFALKGYESGTCGTSGPKGFFSIDGQILLDSPINCPEVSSDGSIQYILQDSKTLEGGSLSAPTNFDVCLNEFGWYSQEYSTKNGTGESCITGEKCPCANTSILCGKNTIQSCKTQFQRSITFQDCDDINNAQYCVQVTSKVWWGSGESDFLELSQILTPLD